MKADSRMKIKIKVPGLWQAVASVATGSCWAEN